MENIYVIGGSEVVSDRKRLSQTLELEGRWAGECGAGDPPKSCDAVLVAVTWFENSGWPVSGFFAITKLGRTDDVRGRLPQPPGLRLHLTVVLPAEGPESSCSCK